MGNRTKRMIAVACAATLLLGGTMASYAATGFNSKGKISFAGSLYYGHMVLRTVQSL